MKILSNLETSYVTQLPIVSSWANTKAWEVLFNTQLSSLYLTLSQLSNMNESEPKMTH